MILSGFAAVLGTLRCESRKEVRNDAQEEVTFLPQMRADCAVMQSSNVVDVTFFFLTSAFGLYQLTLLLL